MSRLGPVTLDRTRDARKTASTVMAMVSAPTIDDARAAGRALTGAGAREVLAFGSVARGDAAPYSDIDLVVVLNDLDYRQRRSIAVEFKAVADAAAGRSGPRS